MTNDCYGEVGWAIKQLKSELWNGGSTKVWWWINEELSRQLRRQMHKIEMGWGFCSMRLLSWLFGGPQVGGAWRGNSIEVAQVVQWAIENEINSIETIQIACVQCPLSIYHKVQGWALALQPGNRLARSYCIGADTRFSSTKVHRHPLPVHPVSMAPFPLKTIW